MHYSSLSRSVGRILKWCVSLVVVATMSWAQQPNLSPGFTTSAPPPVREGTADLGTGAMPDHWNPPEKKQPYQIQSDAITKQLMEDLAASLCDQAAKGRVLRMSQTSVPQSAAFFDEVKYIVERIVDRGMTLIGSEDDSSTSLSYLLFHSEQPSMTGKQNPYVKHTKTSAVKAPDGKGMISRELALAFKVSQVKDGSLSPADLMRLSLEVCGGDYPSATLTAHNFLKEIAYSGRGGGLQAVFMNVEPFPGKDDAAKLMNKNILTDWRGRLKGTPFDVYDMGGEFVIRLNPGAPELAAKLLNSRVTGDPHQADKMGPWYHAFGILFLSSVASGGRYTGQLWAEVESAARHIPGMPSKPDYYKELLTSMAGSISGRLIDCINKTKQSSHVTVRHQQSDWYCTNRPVIDAPVALPPIISTAEEKKP